MGKVRLTATTVLLLTPALVFAQMGNGQVGGMTGSHSRWGMGFGWGTWIILLVLVVLGAGYLRKKK